MRVERPPQRFSAEIQIARARAIAEPTSDLRRRAPCAVHISLYFDERDWPHGQFAIGVEHGIVAVLPALVREPGVGLPIILDESVVIAIAMRLDPRERRLDIRP